MGARQASHRKEMMDKFKKSNVKRLADSSDEESLPGSIQSDDETSQEAFPEVGVTEPNVEEDEATKLEKMNQACIAAFAEYAKGEEMVSIAHFRALLMRFQAEEFK